MSYCTGAELGTRIRVLYAVSGLLLVCAQCHGGDSSGSNSEGGRALSTRVTLHTQRRFHLH